MNFHSILFASRDDKLGENAAVEPECFHDLHLDQVVNAITAGRDDYDLKPFFHAPLECVETVEYRHEIFRDLETDMLFAAIKVFSEQMRRMHQHLAMAEKLSYAQEKQRWVLQAAILYADATTTLLRELKRAECRSRGFADFRTWLSDYVASAAFVGTSKEAQDVSANLAAIRYCVLIKNAGVTVRNHDGEIDYTVAVEATFAKFKQGAVKDYRSKFATTTGLNHVEGMILKRVALLNPEPFAALAAFCASHSDFADPVLLRFDREIQFYVSYLEYAAGFKSVGLKFCFPRVSNTDKSIRVHACFDLALAAKLVAEKQPVVANDFELGGGERMFVVTGPNQGGKTTFSRMFGQLHYLARLGCPVPGAEARLFLCDLIFTHFEREEQIASLHGKLESDVVRIHRILEEATPASVVIMNELFSSTTLKDAVTLSRKVMARIFDLDLLCVWVTFLDELSTLNEKTVSLVAAVRPDDPTVRTFRIERRPADGLSHAVAIAKKYRLTYAQLKERMTV